MCIRHRDEMNLLFVLLGHVSLSRFLSCLTWFTMPPILCVRVFHTLHVVNMFEHNSSTQFMFDWKKAKQWTLYTLIDPLVSSHFCGRHTVRSQSDGWHSVFFSTSSVCSRSCSLSHSISIYLFCFICVHSSFFGQFVWYTRIEYIFFLTIFAGRHER